MFESLDEQIKHDDQAMETPRERWTRFLVIGAVSVVAVGGIFAAVEFVK